MVEIEKKKSRDFHEDKKKSTEGLLNRILLN